jgi:H+/Cl- antiporter ClcA
VVGFVVIEVGRGAARLVRRRYLVLVPLAGVVVAALAIVFSEITGESERAVLFSGSRALDPVVEQAPALSAATLAWLVLFKALAWSVSMGSFRGGPVFPAIFVGTVGGLLAANLPGYPEGAAVPAAIAATVVAVLRLPLAASVIALTLTMSAGLKTSPLIIVAIAVSYLLGERLFALREAQVAGDVKSAGEDQRRPRWRES